MAELKHCPFCGGAQSGDMEMHHEEDCYFVMFYTNVRNRYNLFTEEEMAKAWNRRVPSKPERIKAPFNVGDIVRNKDDHNGRLYRVCRETACYMSLIDVERGLPFTMQRHKRVLARDWELVD